MAVDHLGALFSMTDQQPSQMEGESLSHQTFVVYTRPPFRYTGCRRAAMLS